MKNIYVAILVALFNHLAYGQAIFNFKDDSLTRKNIVLHTEPIRKRIAAGDTSLVSDHLTAYVSTMKNWYRSKDIKDSLKYHPLINKVWETYGEVVHLSMVQSEINGLQQQEIYKSILVDIDLDCNDLYFNSKSGWYSYGVILSQAQTLFKFLEIQKLLLTGGVFFKGQVTKLTPNKD